MKNMKTVLQALLCLVLVFSLTSVVYDSATVVAGEETSLPSVVLTPIEIIEVQLSLQAGWNIVSVPVMPADNSTSAVFPGVAGIFAWNATGRDYYVPTVIDPEKGYWVAVTENTTITISGTPIGTWTTDIKAGWNMIGSVNATASITDPNDDPDGSVIPTAYWWDPVDKSYNLTTDIEPVRGYWLAATEDCVLTLSTGDEIVYYIVLSANQVSDDDANNTIVGELSLDKSTTETIQYTLVDDSDGRFKIIGNQLLLNDYSKIDSEVSSSHDIIVDANNGSNIATGYFTIQAVGSNDIEICPTPNRDPILGRPAIASDGTDFLTAWIENDVVKCARISSEGQILDPGGITIGSTSGYPGYPSVASNGTSYFVVWADGEIYGVRLGLNGTVIDTTPIQITNGANAKLRAPSIVFDGERYFVTWRTHSDQIRGARVSETGSVVDNEGGVIIGYGFYPWVTFDGINYLVVWHKWGNSLDIYGNRISSINGSVLDGSGFLICGADGDQTHASVAFGDTYYLVVWHDTRGDNVGDNDGGAYGARVTTGGEVLDASGIQITDTCRSQVPVLAGFDGTNYLIVWQVDYTHVEHTRLVDIYGQRLSPLGQLVGDIIPVTIAHGHQFGPVMGQSSTQYLVAWSEGGPFERGQGVWGRLLAK